MRTFIVGDSILILNILRSPISQIPVTRAMLASIRCYIAAYYDFLYLLWALSDHAA